MKSFSVLCLVFFCAFAQSQVIPLNNTEKVEAVRAFVNQARIDKDSYVTLRQMLLNLLCDSSRHLICFLLDIIKGKIDEDNTRCDSLSNEITVFEDGLKQKVKSYKLRYLDNLVPIANAFNEMYVDALNDVVLPLEKKFSDCTTDSCEDSVGAEAEKALQKLKEYRQPFFTKEDYDILNADIADRVIEDTSYVINNTLRDFDSKLNNCSSP